MRGRGETVEREGRRFRGNGETVEREGRRFRGRGKKVQRLRGEGLEGEERR